MDIKVSLCPERNESEKEFQQSGCVCAAECSALGSITFVSFKDFSLDHSIALLSIIYLNRKLNEYINKS